MASDSSSSGECLWRPIAAAPVRGLLVPQLGDTKPKKPARVTVPIACLQCQKRKLKCDNTEPVCSQCAKKGVVCQRNTTRNDAKRLVKRADQLEQVLEALCSGTDGHAASVLVRLRLGTSVEDIVSSLQESPSTTSGTSPIDIISPTRSDVESEVDLSGGPTKRLLGENTALFRPTPGSNFASSFWVPLFGRQDYPFVIPETSFGSSRCEPEAIVPLPQLSLPTSVLEHAGDLPEPGDIMASFAQYNRPIGEGVIVHRNLQSSVTDLLSHSGTDPKRHPYDAESSNQQSIFVPAWAMMTDSNSSDVTKMRQAINSVYNEATEMVKNGASVEAVAGMYPNIAALFDDRQFATSPVITQWAARMVRSIKLKSYDFTSFASMYIFWYVMRWMVSPSPETYEAMPEWMRPTPDQLFLPHGKLIDFMIWPAFRDLCVQIPSMQANMTWLVDMSIYEQCEWPGTVEGSLCCDLTSGHVDLIWEAKECLRNLDSWSLGPSFRSFVPYADAYVRIRETQAPTIFNNGSSSNTPC